MIVYKTRLFSADIHFRSFVRRLHNILPCTLAAPVQRKALHWEDVVVILRRYSASAAAADLATLVLIVLDKMGSYRNQAVETPTQQIGDI